MSYYAGSRKSKNNAARVVSGSNDHITPVLKDLHWLPIRKRIEFKILHLTFKCMQGCALLYLRELLVKQANTRTLWSNTKNLLQILHTVVITAHVEHCTMLHHRWKDALRLCDDGTAMVPLLSYAAYANVGPILRSSHALSAFHAIWLQ